MSNDADLKKLQELIKKADDMKKQEKLDLSQDQDLSIAIMNLISIEEHLIFSGAKTGKTVFYDLVDEVRDMRKVLLKRIIKDSEGEVWCISKHLLATSMRLMEVGTKSLSGGRKEEAYDFFEKAYHLYSLFWGLALKLITPSTVKKEADDEVQEEKTEIMEEVVTETKEKEGNPSAKPAKKGVFALLGDYVKKAVDCCVE